MNNLTPIIGFEDYLISKDGEVFSLKTNKYLKPTINGVGYYKVSLTKENKVYTLTIHRILANNFIPNPKSKKYVNHINAIKTDNRLSNLEWCSSSENSVHAFKIGVSGTLRKRVVQKTLNGEVVEVYESITSANKITGICYSSISLCINGKRNKAGGFIWEFHSSYNSNKK